MMDELSFYNQQHKKYKIYDRQRDEGQTLNITDAEAYFEQLVHSHSDTQNILIDLGCGDGYFTSKISELNRLVIGVEPSNLINAAHELIEKSPHSNLRFLKEDAYNLSIDDASVETVISRRGPDPAVEVFRVLKQGGAFVFITIGEMDCLALKKVVGRGQHFATTEKVITGLTEKFKRVGFSEVLCNEFYYDDHFDTSLALKTLLDQVPIFDNFSNADHELVDRYCATFNDNNLKSNRHRVVLVAKKGTK